MKNYEFHCPACGSLQRFGKGGGPCPACGKHILLPPMGNKSWITIASVVVIAAAAGSASFYFKPSRIRAREEAEKQRVEQEKQVEAGKQAMQSMQKGLDDARKSTDAALAGQREAIERIKQANRPTTSPTGGP